MAGKILICALRAICGSPPEFLRLLSRPGFRGLSGPQAASFEGGWIPLWSWCCRSCTANDIFPDLPADTPAWEPEIEAPASMQLALRDGSRSAAARCIPSQVRAEAGASAREFESFSSAARAARERSGAELHLFVGREICSGERFGAAAFQGADGVARPNFALGARPVLERAPYRAAFFFIIALGKDGGLRFFIHKFADARE